MNFNFVAAVVAAAFVAIVVAEETGEGGYKQNPKFPDYSKLKAPKLPEYKQPEVPEYKQPEVPKAPEQLEHKKLEVIEPKQSQAPEAPKSPEFPKFEKPEFPEYKKPELPEYEKPEFPEYKKPEFPEYEKPEFPEYKKPEFPENEKPEFPEYKKPEFPEYEKPEFPKFEKPEFPEYKKPEFPEYEKPEIPKFEKPEFPEYKQPEIPEYEKPEAPMDGKSKKMDDSSEMMQDSMEMIERPNMKMDDNGIPVFNFHEFELPQVEKYDFNGFEFNYTGSGSQNKSNDTKAQESHKVPEVRSYQHPYHIYPGPSPYGPEFGAQYNPAHGHPHIGLPAVYPHHPPHGYQPQPKPDYPKPEYPHQPNPDYQKPEYPHQPNPDYQKPEYPQQPNTGYPKPEYPQQPNTVYPKPEYPQQPNTGYPKHEYPQPKPDYPKPEYPQQPNTGYPKPEYPQQPNTGYPKPEYPQQPNVEQYPGYQPDYGKHDYNKKVVEKEGSYYRLDTCEYRFILDMVQCHEEVRHTEKVNVHQTGHGSYQQGQGHYNKYNDPGYYANYQGSPYRPPYDNRYTDFTRLYGNPAYYVDHVKGHSYKPGPVDHSLFSYRPAVGHPFYAPGLHNTPFAKYYAGFRVGMYEYGQEAETRQYHKEGYYHSALQDFNNLKLHNVVKVDAESQSSIKSSSHVSVSNEVGYEGVTPNFNYRVRLLPNHCSVPGYGGKHHCIVFSGATHPYKMVHRQFVYITNTREVQGKYRYRYENGQRVQY